MPTSQLLNPQYWAITNETGGKNWRCLICTTRVTVCKREGHAIQHESSAAHRSRVEAVERQQHHQANSTPLNVLHQLRQSFTPAAIAPTQRHPVTLPATVTTPPNNQAPPREPLAVQANVNGVASDAQNEDFRDHDMDHGIDGHGGGSDIEQDREQLDQGNHEQQENRDVPPNVNVPNFPPVNRRGPAPVLEDLGEWYPWDNRAACTLDVLTSLPRAVTSDADTEGLIWLLESNGVPNVPSLSDIKASKRRLRKICGVRTIAYKGDLGHPYYVNSIADLIRLEMANPKVRPHLHFYPEETLRGSLSEAWQGDKWRKDILPEFVTPMIRVRQRDFYIFEPTLLRGDVRCMPIRWYRKEGTNLFWCQAYKMEVEQIGTELAWTILENDTMHFEETELVSNVDMLLRNPRDGIPRADRIWGFRKTNVGLPLRWERPAVNPWRTRANGKRVLCFMIWLYCDDTSGNRSKKWNEHNSFLFTAAGLPRAESQKQYNTHFLCTSNCAPPLEMLEGITEQMEEGYREGIEAWDCELNEDVLVFPMTLGDLGDNPMQSEMSCHIGMKGKCYCRKCKTWAKDSPEELDAANAEDDGDDEHEDSSDDGGSDDEPAQPQPRRKRKKRKETPELMAARVLRACKLGEPRTDSQTKASLVLQLDQVKQKETKKKRQTTIRDSGVKDTHLNYFIQQLDVATKNMDGAAAREEIQKQLRAMPREEMMFSPVWRLLGISPSQDMPCEVLHIILLGIVKYFWRDAISRLSPSQKDILSNRLSSLSIENLGPDVSPIQGPTWVKYAGSLVGRDFRLISQVAIFALYDLLPASVLDAWSALSRLVPLVYMPEIDNVDTYCNSLEECIEHFLAMSVKWSPRWMNKPKFHLLKHLTADVRRFGPPILYATEGFESFNAIIRDWSIHSNRQAPSRDIGIQAAEAACIRHLMSGGYFMHKMVTEEAEEVAFRVQIGLGPRLLMGDESVVRKRLGLEKTKRKVMGYTGSLTKRIPFSQTIAHRCGQMSPNQTETCRKAGSTVLKNGDTVQPGHYVVSQTHDRMPTQLAMVRELLIFSQDDLAGVDFVLIEEARVGETVKPYGMPEIKRLHQYRLVSISALQCAVNTQHNCAKNRCELTGQRKVRQEREETDQTIPVTQHKNVGDIVLNTGQMRDARWVQKFAVTIVPSDLTALVRASVQREFAGLPPE
ncbi:hypothetical protein SISSUDRAFT_1061200 [Sistotremastrum suecicum HHB10207 ss-3]|uniref:Uncharacterized protein n=1 Tax=Sistotremastrum suecicum HHB10207 ss-3 TaxID=1314776 RepID=A0A166EAK9_9AGAM|nr:hypothetical protein SISSUDRAFT_1061200 [Sistotremastrum suecicum HHB10207 ss-3]